MKRIATQSYQIIQDDNIINLSGSMTKLCYILVHS